MNKTVSFFGENLPMEQILEACREISLCVCDGAEARVEIRQGECLSVSGADGKFLITYAAKNELFRALSYLPAVMDGGEEVRERPTLKLLSYMADMSRNAVYNMPTAKRMIRYLALMGYNSMMLYTEDTYEVPAYPQFGHMRGRFSAEQLRELDEYCYGFGIELIPCIQTLAHLATALRWPCFARYKDTDDILMVGDERTYAFVDAMLGVCEQNFRTRRINIGMDEAHMIGRGKYLLKNGYHPASEVMLEHLGRVVELCHAHGFLPMMWSDMFFRMQFGDAYFVKEGEISQEVIDKVPAGLELVYWDYFKRSQADLEHMMKCHKSFPNNIVFAGGARKWSGFAPHNRVSLEVTKAQLDACEKFGVRDVIVTAWGDNGAEASQFSVLPAMLYYAERSYAGEPNARHMESRARACFGIGFEELLQLDLPNRMPEALPENGSRVVNPCKYLLYNDPLERLLDCHMNPDNVCAVYASHADALEKQASHPTFGYMFDTLSKLCRVLSVKADMGVRLAKAYRSGDRETLANIATQDIPKTVCLLEAFLEAFRKQWYTENKTLGFTVQDQRLGGLIQRMRAVQGLLLSYLNGERERLEELESDPFVVSSHSPENPYTEFNRWNHTATVGVL